MAETPTLTPVLDPNASPDHPGYVTPRAELIPTPDTETRVLDSARNQLTEWGVAPEELETLVGFVERYRYNDPDTRLSEIVERGADLRPEPSNPSESEVVLPDFFTLDDSTVGQCRELSVKVFRDITENKWLERINENNLANDKSPLEVTLVAGRGPEELNFMMHYWLTIGPAGTYEQGYKPKYERYQADFAEYRANGGSVPGEGMPMVPTDGGDGSVVVDASMRYIAPQSVGYDGQPLDLTHTPDGLALEWKMYSSQPGRLTPGTIELNDDTGEHKITGARSTFIAFTPDYQLGISLGFATRSSDKGEEVLPVLYAGVDTKYSASVYIIDGNVAVNDPEGRIDDGHRQLLSQYITNVSSIQIRTPASALDPAMQ